MRLGVATMTIIDALSIAYATKGERDIVENGYNVSSDLGLVADIIQEKGIAGVREMKVKVGNPIRAMLAERRRRPRRSWRRWTARQPSSTSTTGCGSRPISRTERSLSTEGGWRS